MSELFCESHALQFSILHEMSVIFLGKKKESNNLLKMMVGCGIVVSYVTGVSNSDWLTVGQGLLSLQQLRVEGECFYFFTFIHFCLSPLSLSLISSIISSVSLLLFSGRRQMTQNDSQGLTCHSAPTQSVC